MPPASVERLGNVTPAAGTRLHPQTILILTSLVLGLAIGAQLHNAPQVSARVLAFAKPVGALWIDALTMTIVPLVFGLLVTGVAAAASAASDRVAQRALLWFAILLVGASLVGAALATAALTWAPIPNVAATMRPGAEAPILPPAGDWFKSILPANPIKAAADTAMAPLVVFALIFGMAATRIDPDLGAALTRFFQAVVATMLVIVRWVLLAAPVGVFALALGVGAEMGGEAAGALVHYVLLIAGVCLVVTLLCYVVAAGAGNIRPLTFARSALPAQVVAVSTQSSLASLPAMIEAAPALDVPTTSASIILPLAVSIFRAASVAANMAVAVYLSHLHGIVLSPATLAIGVLVAAAVSLAAVGLPAQVSFFTTIGPICLVLGVPLQALPILLAVETFPDIFRTLGNVTADLAVTRIAGRQRGETSVKV